MKQNMNDINMVEQGREKGKGKGTVLDMGQNVSRKRSPSWYGTCLDTVCGLMLMGTDIIG